MISEQYWMLHGDAIACDLRSCQWYRGQVKYDGRSVLAAGIKYDEDPRLPRTGEEDKRRSMQIGRDRILLEIKSAAISIFRATKVNNSHPKEKRVGADKLRLQAMLISASRPHRPSLIVASSALLAPRAFFTF
ncbi:hypothetical protein Ancab_024605 [Ancistrocladus abbreviatus]